MIKPYVSELIGAFELTKNGQFAWKEVRNLLNKHEIDFNFLSYYSDKGLQYYFSGVVVYGQDKILREIEKEMDILFKIFLNEKKS